MTGNKTRSTKRQALSLHGIDALEGHRMYCEIAKGLIRLASSVSPGASITGTSDLPSRVFAGEVVGRRVGGARVVSRRLWWVWVRACVSACGSEPTRAWWKGGE
jgi:hypothetical protein